MEEIESEFTLNLLVQKFKAVGIISITRKKFSTSLVTGIDNTHEIWKDILWVNEAQKHYGDTILEDFPAFKLKFFNFAVTNSREIFSNNTVKEEERSLTCGDEEIRNAIKPETLSMFTDYRTLKKRVLDVKTLNITQVHPDILKELRVIHELAPAFYTDYFGEIVYNPMETRRIWTRLDREMQINLSVINTYSHPQWRDKEYKPNLHPTIHKLVMNLLPIKEQRNRVLAWFYDAMTNTNQTALLMKGIKGNGKSLFTDLLVLLIGEVNAHKSSDNFFETIFTSELDSKRLIYIDEAELTVKGHITLKNRINNKASIENKGKDVKATERLYINYVLMTNNLIYVEEDDRRFVAPDLGTIKATKILTEEEIIWLANLANESLEDIDRTPLWEFGAFILNKFEGKPKPKVNEDLKGSSFYEMAEFSLSGWKQSVVKTITMRLMEGDDDPIEYSEFQDNYKEDHAKGAFPKPSTISSFIANYNYRGQEVLGFPSTKLGIFAVNPNDKLEIK